jgi:hypothetical protein
MSSRRGQDIRIIACAVFKPALEHLRMKERYPGVRVTYLPSNLHLRPQGLKERLQEEIRSAREKGERVVVLYGECFPDMEEFCRQEGVVKVPGSYCYEMLLGTERFRELIEEIAGTYFAERDLILNFQEYCVKPLELHDEEMRRYCFNNYSRLLFVQQPEDHDMGPRASEVAEFLGLSLGISEADYSYLDRRLIELL